MPQSSHILTGKDMPAFFVWSKNVYISASSVTIDLYIEGIVIKIQSVKILQWKKKSPMMTMMASFLSNINIPAGSLFSPQGKVIVPFWKLSVNAWNVPLIFFPSARLFACIQVMCQPVTSSTDGLISSEQRSKQLSWEGCVCVFVILSCSAQTTWGNRYC